MVVSRRCAFFLFVTVLWSKLLFSSALTGKKYYDRLDIGQDADEATIKKAYKKLAYKWHPDRNLDSKEAANKKFMEVAEAYEILSDHEKRRQYDQFGDAAFSNNNGGGSGGFRQGGGQRFHFSDPSRVFSWVFGDGGDSNFEFDMGGHTFGSGGGGHRHHHYHQQQQQEEELYENDPYVLTLSPDNFHEDSHGWLRLVEFYTPWCGHCRQLTSKWKALAKSFQGVIKVASVNCEKHGNLCQQHRIGGYPTIKAFLSGESDGRKYDGERTTKALQQWAISLLPDNVSRISKKWQMEELLMKCNPQKSRDKVSWKLCVLLFTEKKDTSALYKSLSFMYKEKIAFGEVPGASSSFDQDFNITSRPALIAVCNGEIRTQEVFMKKMNPDRIRTFLNDFAGGRKCDRSVFISSSKDVESLTAAQLKELLREKGAVCDGCIEKSDYIKRVKEII